MYIIGYFRSPCFACGQFIVLDVILSFACVGSTCSRLSRMVCGGGSTIFSPQPSGMLNAEIELKIATDTNCGYYKNNGFKLNRAGGQQGHVRKFQNGPIRLEIGTGTN